MDKIKPSAILDYKRYEILYDFYQNYINKMAWCTIHDVHGNIKKEIFYRETDVIKEMRREYKRDMTSLREDAYNARNELDRIKSMSVREFKKYKKGNA